ncbi:MAG: hypothetical protein K5979_00380 [Ruminococcus sp.]|jgi:predicted membrane channel-forming protein YqfA (hemolysin III family)|nr:hypothetical protein [Ruminococcus sp.]
MKNILCKSSSILVNLIEGVVAVIALTISYAFIFEKDNQDHSIGLGLFVLLVWMLALLIPNLFFKFGGKFHIKDNLYFQLAPLIFGAGIYIIFQFVLY